MAKPYLKNIDPLQIYSHAMGFHAAEDALGRLTLHPNTQVAGQVVQPGMVISALTTELFLKCLVCIETTQTPKGHHLYQLFSLLTPETRSKIIDLWDTHIVPARTAMWDAIEQHQNPKGYKIGRSLPAALLASSMAFETIRYNYEPDCRESEFNIGDLPRILRRIILQLRPEWTILALNVKPLPKAGNAT